MLSKIIPLIPEHEIYVEPFCGGASVFFAKQPVKLEVLNDKMDNLVNFYWQYKTNFPALKKLVKATLHSRSMYRETGRLLKDESHPDFSDPVKRAWAFWVQCSQGFSMQPFSGWAFKSNGESCFAKTEYRGYKKYFEAANKRIQTAQIDSIDAIDCIKRYDKDNAFFFVDPPYVGSDCGHYKGYTQDDFAALLDMLGKIKGKFILTSYPNYALDAAVNSNGWQQQRYLMSVAVSQFATHKKTEVVTMNYNKGQQSLFGV